MNLRTIFRDDSLVLYDEDNVIGNITILSTGEIGINFDNYDYLFYSLDNLSNIIYFVNKINKEALEKYFRKRDEAIALKYELTYNLRDD